MWLNQESTNRGKSPRQANAGEEPLVAALSTALQAQPVKVENRTCLHLSSWSLEQDRARGGQACAGPLSDPCVHEASCGFLGGRTEVVLGAPRPTEAPPSSAAISPVLWICECVQASLGDGSLLSC